MWSASINVTDGQTDRRTSYDGITAPLLVAGSGKNYRYAGAMYGWEMTQCLLGNGCTPTMNKKSELIISSWYARQHQLNFVRRLSWSISSIFQRKFTLSVRRSLKSWKKSLKPLFCGFKVVQGHRCWYRWKARQQCLLWYAACLCLCATVFTLDEPIAVKWRLLRGVPLFDALVRGESPHPAARKLSQTN